MSQRFPTPNVTAGPAGGPPQRYPMRPNYSPQSFPVSFYHGFHYYVWSMVFKNHIADIMVLLSSRETTLRHLKCPVDQEGLRSNKDRRPDLTFSVKCRRPQESVKIVR